MKNKTPKKIKKNDVKKEIKRPAHKKPHVRKYVEAKIPALPAVPTVLIDAKEKEAAPLLVDTPKFVTIEMPEGQTEASLAKAILVSVEELSLITEVLKQINTDERAEYNYAYARVYKEPGVGLIRRQNHPCGAYEFLCKEEIEGSRAENEKVRAYRTKGSESAGVTNAGSKLQANEGQKQTRPKWFKRLLNWFKK